MKCFFCFPDGRYCGKWARNGSRFCHHHQPPAPADDASKIPLHPHARLATYEDLFHFIRESMLAVRMGSISPGQAFAVSSLSDRWMAAERRLGWDASKRVLRNQILPTLVDAEAAAELEREAVLTAGAERQSEEASLAARANRELEFAAAQRAAAQSSATQDAADNGHHESPASQPAAADSNHNGRHEAPTSLPAPGDVAGPQADAACSGRGSGEGASPSASSHKPNGAGNSHTASLPADFAARIIARLEREILKSTAKNLRQRPRDG